MRIFTMKYALRITLIVLIGATAFLASGCSEPDTALPYPIEIEEAKAGRITSDTPFDASYIASLMPGFDVRPYTSFRSGAARFPSRQADYEYCTNV